MSSISFTPTKSTKVCCVCGENKKEVRIKDKKDQGFYGDDVT
jgi:hypothetical protein